MIIFPAIDLKGGACVRLEKGDMNKATLFNKDPLAQAEIFAQQGFSHLHLIDLDSATGGGARGAGGNNSKVIEKMLENKNLKIQMGGGLRSLAQIESCVRAGAWRVILGTIALTHPAVVKEACKKFPRRIVIALDGIDEGKGLKVALQGWKKISEESLLDAAARVKDYGAAAILFTDIARDGIKRGINIEATRVLADQSALPVIASGGLKNIDDIKKLTGAKNIEGVIAGRAIYEGGLDSAEALAWVKANA